MSGTTLTWIIIAIVVVLIVVAVIAFFAYRKNAPRRDERLHAHADELRAKADESALTAQEIEAQEAKARADAATAAAAAERAKAQAAQAAVDQKRYTDDIEARNAEAAEHRAKEEEIRRKADDLDPYVTDAATTDTPPITRRSTAAGEPVVNDATPGEPRRGRHHADARGCRAAGRADPAQHGHGRPGDRRRNDAGPEHDRRPGLSPGQSSRGLARRDRAANASASAARTARIPALAVDDRRAAVKISRAGASGRSTRRTGGSTSAHTRSGSTPTARPAAMRRT